MSFPLTLIVPESGITKPAIERSSVVLPQPLLPSSAIISPRSTSRLTRSSTRCPPYDTLRFWIDR